MRNFIGNINYANNTVTQEGEEELDHQMGLHGVYFDAIKKGTKTVEVRLNDEKRRKIKVGDTIEFIKIPEQNEILTVEVIRIKGI